MQLLEGLEHAGRKWRRLLSQTKEQNFSPNGCEKCNCLFNYLKIVKSGAIRSSLHLTPQPQNCLVAIASIISRPFLWTEEVAPTFPPLENVFFSPPCPLWTHIEGVTQRTTSQSEGLQLTLGREAMAWSSKPARYITSLSAVSLITVSPAGSLLKPMETLFMTSWWFGPVLLNLSNVLSCPWKKFDAVLSDYLFHFFLEKIKCALYCAP